eukprot:1251001-Pyramimonas_sp.AAC.1
MRGRSSGDCWRASSRSDSCGALGRSQSELQVGLRDGPFPALVPLGSRPRVPGTSPGQRRLPGLP